MSTPEIKPGSVVRLRAGGPLMTVEGRSSTFGPRRVVCMWFDAADNLHSGAFHVDLLKVE